MFKKIEGILGINQRNASLINQHNPRKNFSLADDKYLAKRIMQSHDIACPRTYAVIDKMGYIEATWQKVAHHQSLVIKPAKGMGGNGIMVLDKKEDVWMKGSQPVDEESIFFHIANILFGSYSNSDTDTAIIEERIHSHQFFSSFFEEGVPDLRLILFKQEIVMGMLRMPTQESGGKANLHQGGLGIGIDIETGTLTHVFNGEHYFNYHPDTNQKITGLKVPFWDRIKSLSIETASAFPLDYLGADIVIDQKRGPLVMEVNVRPGLGIQMANQMGLKDKLPPQIIG